MNFEHLQSNNITVVELAAAYLTLFFKGKLTQTALSAAIELSNITSTIKLPTTFDGLVNKIINSKTILNSNYDKKKDKKKNFL